MATVPRHLLLVGRTFIILVGLILADSVFAGAPPPSAGLPEYGARRVGLLAEPYGLVDFDAVPLLYAVLHQDAPTEDEILLLVDVPRAGERHSPTLDVRRHTVCMHGTGLDPNLNPLVPYMMTLVVCRCSCWRARE